MPKSRRTFRRRRFKPRRNRRRFKRRGNKSLLRKVNIALARSKPERKAVDEGITITSVPAAGVVREVVLLGIFQGVESNQRIGDRLYMRNFDLRWSIRYNALSDFPMQLVRVIYVMWSQEGSPTVTEILTDASIFSHYNKANAGTYKIMSDRTYNVGDRGNTSIEIMRRNILQVKRTWVYTNSLDVFPTDHRVFYILIGNEDVVLNQANFDLNVRANYYDN